MSTLNGRNLADLSMVELFRLEVEQQAALLTEGLMAIERKESGPENLAAMMRAAHSMKGAARLVDCQEVVELAHAIEETLSRDAQHGLGLDGGAIDTLLDAVDMVDDLAREKHEGEQLSESTLTQYHSILEALRSSAAPAVASPVDGASGGTEELKEWERRRGDRRGESHREPRRGAAGADAAGERIVRLSVERFDQLIALAGEATAAARWLRPYTETLRRLKRKHWEIIFDAEAVQEKIRGANVAGDLQLNLTEMLAKVAATRDLLEEKVSELEVFDVKLEALASRLHAEVMASRMRPFRDGVRGLPRIVRTIARSVGKEVRLEMTGLDTSIDREVLQRIEAPLSHLLNNAVDHGIESPDVRECAGKPHEGTIRIDVFQQRGLIHIRVSDDGRGIDREQVIAQLVKRHILDRDTALSLSDEELFGFLILPGFSTREQVSPLSGRGVGLDAVAEMLRAVGGSMEMTSKAGAGSQFTLRFPVTRTVTTALLVQIGAEPYAVPLNRVDRIARVARDEVRQHDGHDWAIVDGEERILLSAARILELPGAEAKGAALSVLVLRDQERSYAVVVDKLVAEKELVLRPVPPQLGKVRDVSAVAILDNGNPVLVLDVDEFLQSGRAVAVRGEGSVLAPAVAGLRKKRILIVDDSVTVRELEGKLLSADGYEVTMAVDGLDGWNLVRNGAFDLVVTDVDMPRLDGLQLVKMMKHDEVLRHIPVMVVSYMDRPKDRARALDAGADRFLAKAQFHDDALRLAVRGLLGQGAA